METRQVRLFTAEEPLRMSSGATLGPIDVGYETYGTLSAAGGKPRGLQERQILPLPPGPGLSSGGKYFPEQILSSVSCFFEAV